jgi:hypothetical protein
MTRIRTLNSEGLARFAEYLAALRGDPKLAPPMAILSDGLYSDPFEPEVSVELQDFANSHELGSYLNQALANCEDRLISRNHALWSWVALFYFDQLCRPDSEGKRRPLEDAVYVLEQRFSFRRYYRHAVRTAWLAVKEHGEQAKVLLLTSGRGTRTDIGEQLGAYQHLFSNKTIIKSAYAMYFDQHAQKPKKGAGGKGAGSPRRLASIARQLELTYDLQDCPLTKFLALLPREFKVWVRGADMTLVASKAAPTLPAAAPA